MSFCVLPVELSDGERGVGEGGRAKSYNGENAWSSLNHLILSVSAYETHVVSTPQLSAEMNYSHSCFGLFSAFYFCCSSFIGKVGYKINVLAYQTYNRPTPLLISFVKDIMTLLSQSLQTLI